MSDITNKQLATVEIPDEKTGKMQPMYKVYCELCGKKISRDDFHIWNTRLYCSTKCFEKDKKIKEEFEKEKQDA